MYTLSVSCHAVAVAAVQFRASTVIFAADNEM